MIAALLLPAIAAAAVSNAGPAGGTILIAPGVEMPIVSNGYSHDYRGHNHMGLWQQPTITPPAAPSPVTTAAPIRAPMTPTPVRPVTPAPVQLTVDHQMQVYLPTPSITNASL